MGYKDDRISHLIDNFWAPGRLESCAGRRHFLRAEDDNLAKYASRYLVMDRECMEAYEKDLRPHLQAKANHLNSSQMFCFNLFQPLRSSAGREVLSRLLSYWLGLKSDPRIERTEFEYEPEGPKPKRTNFDFYAEGPDIKVYFEIKYTEGAYGGASRGRRTEMEFDEWKEKQWRDFYGPQVGRSRYLKTYDCKRFFDDYQILRNVAYITEENGEKEYVVFVAPMHNSGVKLLPQIVGREWDHVYQVNAEDIFTDVMIMVGSRADDRGFDFEKYYKRFCEFYFG